MFDDPETPRKEPGGENPWYVLMTIAGTQPEPGDLNFHDRNRRYWNGWQAQALTDDQKQWLIREGRATQRDLAPLQEEEQAKIAGELAVRAGVDVAIRPGETISLEDVGLARTLDCGGYVFAAEASFDGISGSMLVLDGATFLDRLSCEHARIRHLHLVDAFLRGDFDCQQSEVETLILRGATLSGRALFRRARIATGAEFDRARFSGFVSFESAEVNGWARFHDSSFRGPMDFSGAKFHSDGGSAFARSTPPEFFNAALHEDTDFSDVRWPDPPASRDEAIEHRRAYERLKLLMDSQKKTHDEHMFFRMEMRCREIEAPGTLVTWGSKLFGLVSDYGWSVARPLLALLILWLTGAALIGMAEWGDACLGHAGYDCLSPPADAAFPAKPLGLFQSLFLGLTSTFAFTGIGRSFMADELGSLTAFSEIVAGAQMILGPVLIFLLLLALRNRFRMR